MTDGINKLSAANADVLHVFPDGCARLTCANGLAAEGVIMDYYVQARGECKRIFCPSVRESSQLIRFTYLIQDGFIQSPGPALAACIAQSSAGEIIPPGSVPIGVGGQRLAFLCPDGCVAVFGAKQRIRANPYSLFPKRISFYDCCAQTLELRITQYADGGQITFEDAETMRRLSLGAGFCLHDSKIENLGRTASGRLVLVDTDASTALCGDLSRWLNPAEAIPAYQRALEEVQACEGVASALKRDLHIQLYKQLRHASNL